MDASELQQYEQQLAQVQSALQSDEGNQDLQSLEKELQNVISLLKQQLGDAGHASTSASASTAKAAPVPASSGRPANPASHSVPASDEQQQQHRYAVGDECQAKYQADGRWYAARVIAIGGSMQSPMYTVLFKGYDETAILPKESLRPTAASKSGSSGHGAQAPGSSSSYNYPTSAAQSTPSYKPAFSAEEEAERERKRKRSEKKAKRSETRTAEANAVQNSWQKFAKKAEKKKGAAIGGKSMFKTPDDPLAKVGVIGAGRGMTQYGDRKKHTYEDEPLG